MMKDMKISMIHGAGGEGMGEVLDLLSSLSHTKTSGTGSIGLEALDDGAVIPIGASGEYKIVFTTDSHVVRPLFFPGGDIGRISVAGTINDLAVMGAKPLALSCGMVIEEGFSFDELKRILASMDAALGEVGAALVTGDTKVVERGSVDGIIINTAGIGVAEQVISDAALRIGDVIIVSGTLGDHGLSILVTREGFDLSDQIVSDVAPIYGVVAAAMAAGGVHAMKDPTRGGFSNAINEMAKKAGVQVRIKEADLPIREGVRSAAAVLGIDPLEVANEGKVVMGVAADRAEVVLEAIRSHHYGKDAAICGYVVEGKGVIMETIAGGERFIEPPLGDPIPRVC
jgi:hydrogenase expression/formation protein HypE